MSCTISTMAARLPPPPRALGYAIPFDGPHEGESDDYDTLSDMPFQPPNAAPVYAVADGDYDLWQWKNTTSPASSETALVNPPNRASDGNMTVKNAAYTGPPGAPVETDKWGEYLTKMQLMEQKESARKSADDRSSPPPIVSPQHEDQRFWHALNIVTLVVALVTLIVVLAHVAKGGSTSGVGGGVEASMVNGLSAWQEEVMRNLTAVQSDLAALIEGLS